MLLLAAVFTGCTEDFKDWADPIFNPEPNAITIPGVTATVVAQNVDLGKADDAVRLISVSTASAPEGTILDKMRIIVTPEGVEGAEPKTIPAISTPDGTFSKETLQEMILEYYGRRPDVRTFNTHVYLDGVYQGQAAYIDAGTVQLTLIPEAPKISQNYYIVGGTLDWAGSAASKEQKFRHSDLDVYEDPIFSIIIDAAEGDTWFAIGDDEGCDAITNDSDWSKLLGIVGGDNEATSGSLDYRYNMGADNSFKVPAGAKKIRVTIDMMEQTFKVEAVNIADSYYLIGDMGTWGNDKSMKFSHSDKDVFDDPVFTYVFAGGKEMWFAFGDAAALDAIDAGDWNQLFGTKGASEDLSGSFDRRYNLGGDHSFHVDGSAKFYRFTINPLDMTYEITPLNFEPFIYFIGATDGWAQAEQKLALTDESGIYTGYIYCADPNGWGNEFKFQRVPGDWGTEINFGTFTGGVSGDFAEGGGGNIKATAGEGIYYIEADMATGTLKGTRITNMNLVGDFNGWNPGDDAQQMTWNAAEYCYEITGARVNSNGWKFTANNDWGINLGGNDSVEPSMKIDDLAANGKNLGAVGSTIKLYPTRKTSDKIYCTVE